jgi:hypothetical protein
LGREAVVGVHGENVRPHAGSSRASGKGLRAKIAKKKKVGPPVVCEHLREEDEANSPDWESGDGGVAGVERGRCPPPRWLSARPERDRAQWSGGTRGGLRKLSWGQASVDRTVGPTPYLLLYLVSTRY